MTKYWSTLTQSLKPYVPGEQPQDQEYLKLNTNENPFAPSELTQKAIRDSVSDALRLYPDPEALKLKTAIADYYGVDVSEVFVGNGSDEVLAFSFMAFFKNGKKIAFPDITYSFYPVYCTLFDIEYLCVPLTDSYTIDIDRFPDGVGGIIFPNPNAPTGVYLGLNSIEALLARRSDIVVIVDEAYVDFGGDSCVCLLNKYPNLLVVQTLSKSRSLAGLRVGFAIGNKDLIQGLDRVKNSFNSYPLDALAINGAVAAFQDKDYFEQCCAEIIRVREWVAGELEALSYLVLPSKSNFLFARHPRIDGATLYAALKKKGILVRHFDVARIQDYVRISIGTHKDMARLLAALKSL